MEDLEGEIWKPIFYDKFNFIGFYEVSNMGRVKNLNNKKIVKGFISGYGYRVFKFSTTNGVKHFKGHRLVISSFGIIVPKGYVVDHNNSNKADNKLSNLTVVTVRQNCSKERTLKSGLSTGVVYNGKYIQSQIFLSGNAISLGLYKSEITAASAYKKALYLYECGEKLDVILDKINEYRASIGLKLKNWDAIKKRHQVADELHEQEMLKYKSKQNEETTR